MRGFVMTEFVELAERLFGEELVDRLLDSADLPSGGAYTAVDNYDHGEIVKLVTAHRDDKCDYENSGKKDRDGDGDEQCVQACPSLGTSEFNTGCGRSRSVMGRSKARQRRVPMTDKDTTVIELAGIMTAAMSGLMTPNSASAAPTAL